MNNKANREVCDVDIRVLKTMEPYLFFDTANETGIEISGDEVYAMAKGARRIAFSNPMENTVTITAQVVPFKFYAMLTDGVIDTEAMYAEKKEIECATAGELILPVGAKVNTVFVYKAGEYATTPIEGTYSEVDNKFTATVTSDIAVGEKYEAGYIITKTTGVSKISFNDRKAPQDYFITMLTNDKDEDGNITAKKIVVYKAKPQRNATFSYSSEGDPVSVEMSFSCLSDKNGNNIDMIEFED